MAGGLQYLHSKALIVGAFGQSSSLLSTRRERIPAALWRGAQRPSRSSFLPAVQRARRLAARANPLVDRNPRRYSGGGYG